tara:strand:+ start:11072 stop:11224 length:153 start_codon:yes stop_codon:yes gene_type:complete
VGGSEKEVKATGLAKLNVQALGAGVFSVNAMNTHTVNAFNSTLYIHFSIV